jgi:two-component system response regulator RpaA
MKKEILIVDDNTDILEMLVLFVGHLGYKPLAAKNGQEGLEKAKNHSPALIILDLALHDISGIEVASIIKRDPRTASIPIVVLTALVADSWKEAARRVGVSEFLCKPFPFDELKQIIERLIEVPDPPVAMVP